MTDLDENDLFGYLDLALAERRKANGDLAENDEGGVGAEQDGIVVPLADGDVHICKGGRCPHVRATKGDHQLVCTLSGITFGSDCMLDSDPTWTGRSTTSGDPDAVAGTPIGGWRPRRDAYGDSRRAFEASSSITAEQAVYVETEKEKQQRIARANVKRGALCVDEVREEPVAKRCRAPRRNVLDQDTIHKLSIEASSVIDKLTTPKNPPREMHAEGNGSPPLEDTKESAKAKPDPRLQNVDFVKQVLMKRYIERVRKGEDRFDALRVHDVFVCANEFVRQQRRQAREREEAQTSQATVGRPKRHVFSGELKSKIVGLVLSLWRACCLSPYLAAASKGSDSFRPFVAGVLYSLKRGLTLKALGDIEVIPSLPNITQQLPTLRSADASTVARQLQSSSHRGVCTLHRAVASLDEHGLDNPDVQDCRQAFANCEVVARQLEAYANRTASSHL